MANEEKYSEFSRKVLKGMQIAYEKMLHEEALRDESIVVADDEGNIKHIPAKNLLKKGTPPEQS
ncbi:histidine kinase [Hoylesella loescheii]|jgi:sensory box histidine kinase|uniref:histidine kinase n=1 Tax=Hoylesella loescheii TaxID=840 RepID=UPI0026E996FB|nr:histidine kinase [Hoylesella loescheii]